MNKNDKNNLNVNEAMNKIEPIVVNNPIDDNNNSIQMSWKFTLNNGCIDASPTLLTCIADDNSNVFKNIIFVGSQNGYVLHYNANSCNILDACNFLDAKIECSVTILSTSTLGKKRSNANDLLSQLQPTTNQSFAHVCACKEKGSYLKK